MGEKCYCCGYSFCLEKHHPDRKEKMIVVHNWTKQTKKEYKWINNNNEDKIRAKYNNLIKKEKQHISITVELKHTHPDNWEYLCPNCHRIIHTPKYRLDINKLCFYLTIAKINNIALTKEMIPILNQIKFMKMPNKSYTKINANNEKKMA